MNGVKVLDSHAERLFLFLWQVKTTGVMTSPFPERLPDKPFTLTSPPVLGRNRAEKLARSIQARHMM